MKIKTNKTIVLLILAVFWSQLLSCIPSFPSKTTRPRLNISKWEELEITSKTSCHKYKYMFAKGPSEDAPAFLLLPGGIFDNRIWLNFSRLAVKFNVYALNWPDNSLFYTGHVSDFEKTAIDFIKALEIESLYVAGVSAGGYAAVELASGNYGPNVKGLVVISSVMFSITGDEVENRMKMTKKALGFAPGKFRSLVEYIAGRTEYDKAPGEYQQLEIYYTRPYSYYYQIFKMSQNQGSLKQNTQDIKCPTLLLHGTKDSIMDVELARMSPKVFKDAVYKEFEGKKHSMTFSDGPLLVSTILDFLAEK